MTETAFSARHLPWAKVGTIIDEPHVTSQRAAELAGIDFTVELRQLAFRSDDADDTDSWTDIPARRAIVRQDTNEWFEVCSTDYRVLQYCEAFAFVDSIDPKIVAAGPLSGGKQAFMVIQHPSLTSVDFDIAGESDPHEMYVVVRTSHDRSKAIEVALMSLRGRCMNQLTLPTLMKDAPQRWSVRHVGNPAERLREAQLILQRLPRYAETIERRAVQLASTPVTESTFRPIMKRVLRSTLAQPDEMINRIVALHSRPTVGFQDTAWGWVNTVSEYFQWGRDGARRTAQSTFTDSLSGDAASYTNKLMTSLMSRA